MAIKVKNLDELEELMSNMTVVDLRKLAAEIKVVPRNRSREELIKNIRAVYTGEKEPEEKIKQGRPRKGEKGKTVEQEAPEITADTAPSADNVDPNLPREGILEIMSDGYGFIHTINYSHTPGKDYYVSANMIPRS